VAVSSSSDVRFKARAPRFLLRPYERLISEDPNAGQALRDWIYFFEASLRYLFFVLDAERVAVGVEPSARASKVLNGNLAVSLGVLADGVWGLTERLGGQTERLSGLVGSLEEARLKDFVGHFLHARNDWSHRHLTVPAQAQRHLEELRPHLRLFTQALSRIDGDLMVAVVSSSAGLDGTRTHLLRASDLHRFTVSGHVPDKRPFLLWSNGDALSLFPGLLVGGRDRFELLWDLRGGRPEVVSEDCVPAPWTGDSDDFPGKLTALFEVARASGVVREGLVPDRMGQADQSPDAPRLPEGFEVLEKLGEGGIGSVWKARWNERIVAVKVLHPSVSADTDAQERFFREVQALEKVKSGGVVEVIHPGWETAEGRFVVMQFLSGGDLAGKAPMQPDRAVEVCLALLRTLSEVHGHGIIHRDVKPTNILLDDRGMPHLVDFGIARDQANATITHQEDRLGTPAFWAPEQAAGEDVTPATDLYAVARLLGFLVTDSIERRAHLAALPAALQAIYRRATEESPARRYQRAENMQRAVETATKAGLVGSPVPVGASLSGRLVTLDAGEACGSCWLHAVQDEEGPRAILLSSWHAAGHEALKKAAKRAERVVEKHDGLAFVELPSKSDAPAFLRGDAIEWNATQIAGAAAAAAALGGLAVLGAGVAGTLLTNDQARAGAISGLAAALGVGGVKKKRPKVKIAVENAPYLAGFAMDTRDPARLRARLGRLFVLVLLQVRVGKGLATTQAEWSRIVGNSDAVILATLVKTHPAVAGLLAARKPLNNRQLRVVARWAASLLKQAAATDVTASSLAPFVAQREGSWCVLTPNGYRPVWS
jgi:hypothetical protein